MSVIYLPLRISFWLNSHRYDKSTVLLPRIVMAWQYSLVFNRGGSDVRVKANTSKSTICWQVQKKFVVSWFSELVRALQVWLVGGFHVFFVWNVRRRYQKLMVLMWASLRFFFELAFTRLIFTVFFFGSKLRKLVPPPLPIIMAVKRIFRFQS